MMDHCWGDEHCSAFELVLPSQKCMQVQLAMLACQKTGASLAWLYNLHAIPERATTDPTLMLSWGATKKVCLLQI